MYKLAHIVGVLIALTSFHCFAIETPKSLEEWKPWILEKYPELTCPFLFNSGDRSCRWYSSLTIEANDKGAKFSQRVEVYKNDWVALPGNAGLWPQNINDNKNIITTRDRNGVPEVYLTSGSHQLTGELLWPEMPRTITIPEQTGLVQLTLNGKVVNNPALEGNNQLWLANNQPKNTAAQQDALNVRVFRKVDDEIPLKITTQIQLGISGKEREIQLGQFLLEGFTALELDSKLPAHIEKDGSLRIQLKPGNWEINLVSQSMTSNKSLTYKTTSELWPQEEIWVFSAQRQLRSVQISGVQSIDPQQTQLPEDWKKLPAYLVTPQTHFTLEELYRGENKEVASDIKLNRSAWLSFDGKRFIFNDDVRGELHSSRIEMIKPIELTSATINGEPQLITSLDKNKNAGVEIRERNLALNAVSQMDRNLSIPVTGWNQDINSAQTSLFLPPGWSLLTATGASSEYGSWISKWTLWDMFTVLIIVVAFARITSPLLGLIAGLTLVIVYQRIGAPIFIWLNLIAVIALANLVSGKFKSWIIRYGYLSFLSLVLITLPFAVREARIMINPSLEDENFWVVSSSLIMQTSAKHKAVYSPAPVAASAQEARAEEIVVTGVRAEPKTDMVEEVTAEDAGSLPDKTVADSFQRTPGVSIKKKFTKKYDPSQQTQTGIAVPNHQQNSVTLRWDGPIKQEEMTSLILISPIINKLGNLLAILLPLLMASILLQKFLVFTDKILPRLKFSSSAATGIASCLLVASVSIFTPDSAQADVNIDPTILKELEARLTEAPKCLPDCAAIERIHININQDQLTLDLVVNANDLIALPLPADHQQWWPNQVTVDGKAAALVQASNQTLLVTLPKGQHNLSISANVQGHDALNLQFPLPLHNVSATNNGWELSGLPSAEQNSQSLQLQRVEHDQNAAKAEHLRADPIAAFVIVKRIIRLDLDWSLTTVITRVAPQAGAINLEVPLLNGESPLSTKTNANGKVSVHLETNQNEYEWSSNLKEITPIKLQAAQNVPWIEIWTLDISPLWHSQTTGIAPVQLDKQMNIPIWQPWPGETLVIDVRRPQATLGSYVTVDEATLHHKPGNHNSLSKLNLTIRSNQGGQYTFKLPEGTKLSTLEIDNNEQLISATNGVLKLPLHPGSQKIALHWKQDEGLHLITKTPDFVLENGSSNQNIIMEIPYNRWVLWLGGPQVGPSVLLWGMLLVMGFVAYGLGRTKLTPLKPYEWVLLSLGICTLNMWTFVLVAVWLLALSQRGKLNSITAIWKFKFLQLSLFALSTTALIALVTTLPDGLLSSPDMHIVGRNTYNSSFYWYQDYSDPKFPTAWVISLPLWSYKLAILLWSLWLAASLMKWLRWGWQQLSVHGLWDVDQAIVLHPTAPITENKIADENAKEV
jgi:hypothetical protein